jgi:hypothetical protein
MAREYNPLVPGCAPDAALRHQNDPDLPEKDEAPPISALAVAVGLFHFEL